MTLTALVSAAHQQGASDLHLEAGLPAAVRVRGTLRTVEDPVPAQTLLDWARQLVGEAHWPEFQQRQSADLSRTVAGVRCRINVMRTARGVGIALRLLSTFQPTLERLNLHPDLRKLVAPHNGLILMSGPTGCGKSSTLAALMQEINLTEARHIVTIESPIEYTFTPRRAYIRQREVGRDTPSFEQGLLDALREDPDVLMVGEMREPETMRLTLNASETGHLVLTTVHSSSCVEALQRVVAAFPAEIQSNVAAQLADSLVAVIAQRLRFRADLNLRVPECEVLIPTLPVKAHIRTREFFKIGSALETGAAHGMWTFARYVDWLSKRKTWHRPEREPAQPDLPAVGTAAPGATPPPLPPPEPPAPSRPLPRPAPTPGGPRIDIEPTEDGFGKILK